MRRRIGADDFRQITEMGTRLERGSWWLVADDYELQGGEIVAKPQLSEDGRAMFWPYQPLDEVPDLFLKFARLYHEPDFEAGALEWCRRYGLPGGSGPQENRRPPDIWASDPAVFRMSISAFHEEVEEARRVLVLYEAAWNRDEKAALSLISAGEVAYLRSTGMSSGDLGRKALERALGSARWRVNSVLHDFCVPTLDPSHESSLEVKSSWNFYNLLGAMYLQMYWLMASSEDVARCKYCGHIISLARPYPEGRKRRRDKRFCDDACRQAHHRAKMGNPPSP